MKIKLKNICTPEKANKIFKKLGIKGSFITQKHNQDWLDEINSDPNSPQAHLKPENRELTMDELKQAFKNFTEVGLTEFDLYFGRTSDEQMKLIAQFIQEQQGYIKYVRGGDMLMDRGDVTKDQERILELLEKKRLPNLELPKELQTKNPPSSGLLLCKSFSPNPFWVLFGKVDKPAFMYNRVYVNNIHNSLHKDSEGRGFLLLPLYPIGRDVSFFEDVYTKASQMGLREHPNYFLARVYTTAINFKPDEKELAEEFNNYYSLPELIERFKATFKSIATSGRPFSNHNPLGFSYVDDKTNQPFSLNNKKGNDSRILVLNAFTLALKTYSIADIGKLIDELEEVYSF